MDLNGKNICVLDLETAASADDCRHCGQEEHQHSRSHIDGVLHCPLAWNTHTVFERIGWDSKAALRLSIGCYWNYADMRLHWFDMLSLEATMRSFVECQPLLVSFYGIQFDFALMRALLRQGEDASRMALCDAFKTLCAGSYDILATIWHVDPARKLERGLNSLGAISEANGYGSKDMDGATAPRRWRAGHYAEVIAYNVEDVLKTKALFEQIIATGAILRGDGQAIALPLPAGLVAEGGA